MNKKVVVLGGGNGLSTLLKGLKQFPLDLTAIVSVCDDGASSGILRKEFNTPAMGDIRRVLISLSEQEPVFDKMFNYRFKTDSYLNGHALGNFLLQAMTDITGSLSSAIIELEKVLNLKGKVLPLTEKGDITLVAEMTDGEIVEGEHKVVVEDVVAVEEIHPFRLARLQTLVACCSSTRERLLEQSDVGTVFDVLFTELVSAIRTLVVHDDDLLWRDARFQDAIQRLSNVVSSVFYRNDNGDVHVDRVILVAKIIKKVKSEK